MTERLILVTKPKLSVLITRRSMSKEGKRKDFTQL